MEGQKEIKFVVDDQYENEKGVFTVLSIKKNDMVIRWEDGEEIQTTVELQTTIQSRRQWEELQVEVKAAEAKKSSKAGKAGARFCGFQPGDFKTSAARTNWRGRAQLGGAVTQNISAADFKFNSWAFSTKSELHWQDVDKRKKDTAGTGARFFVRLDSAGMTYGFLVSRQADQDSGSADWGRFHEWAAQEENEKQIRSLAEAHDLAMYNSTGAFLEPMAVSDTYFEISRKVEKEFAISREKEIAKEIATLFSAMVPLYMAAVGF